TPAFLQYRPSSLVGGHAEIPCRDDDGLVDRASCSLPFRAGRCYRTYRKHRSAHGTGFYKSPSVDHLLLFSFNQPYDMRTGSGRWNMGPIVPVGYAYSCGNFTTYNDFYHKDCTITNYRLTSY